MEHLGLADVVMIASAVLGTEPESLLRTNRIGGADSAVNGPAASFGGEEFHPGLARNVAVLGYRLTKIHPFPDGNKRVAFLAMVEMAERNGARWNEPPGDPDGDQTVAMIVAAAAGSDDEPEFIAWVEGRIS